LTSMLVRPGDTVKVTMKVNGAKHEVEVEPRKLLVHTLRDMGLTGTKVGCDSSVCGACTVILNGRPVKSCTLLTVQADQGEIITIEGISSEGKLHPIQEAFWENHALQCGYCTSGMIMNAYAFLKEHKNPTDEEIRDYMHGNICRCTGYQNIVNAVREAAKRMGQ